MSILSHLYGISSQFIPKIVTIPVVKASKLASKLVSMYNGCEYHKVINKIQLTIIWLEATYCHGIRKTIVLLKISDSILRATLVFMRNYLKSYFSHYMFFNFIWVPIRNIKVLSEIVKVFSASSKL